MKTIIITTHNNTEFNSLVPENANTIKFCNGNYEFIDLVDTNTRKIRIVVGSENNNECRDGLNTILNECDNPIVLYHLLNFNLSNNSHNVSSQANTNDRANYEKLLNANFQGAIDIEDKKNVFDEVWEYFEKKNCEINQHKIALSILDWINKKGDQNDLTAEQKDLVGCDDIKNLYEAIPNKGSLNTKNCVDMKIYTEFKEKLFEKYKDPSLKKNSTN